MSEVITFTSGKGGVSLYTGPVITSYRYTHYDSSDAGGSYLLCVPLSGQRIF